MNTPTRLTLSALTAAALLGSASAVLAQESGTNQSGEGPGPRARIMMQGGVQAPMPPRERGPREDMSDRVASSSAERSPLIPPPIERMIRKELMASTTREHLRDAFEASTSAPRPMREASTTMMRVWGSDDGQRPMMRPIAPVLNFFERLFRKAPPPEVMNATTSDEVSLDAEVDSEVEVPAPTERPDFRSFIMHLFGFK